MASALNFKAHPFQPSSAVASAPAKPPALTPLNSSHEYQIVGKLGNGGHAVVVEVLTPRGEHHAALKIHKLGRGYFEESTREVENLRAVQNAPHTLKYRTHFKLPPEDYQWIDPILKIPQGSIDIQRHAIVTDLLPCKDVYQMYLRGQTRLSFRQIMSIGKQGLETLNYLKSIHMAHLDLKPENISYNATTDELTICDFGAAKHTGQMRPTDLVQSRWYRAPERVLYKVSDESVDMWSWGAILFELYTGEPLIPTEGGDKCPQTISDHLHIMEQNIGKKLSQEFIRSMPRDLRENLFKRTSEDTLVLKLPPSIDTTKRMERYEVIGKTYGNMPIWQARIFNAANSKGARPSEARELIGLIGPMLRYENRTTPEESLKIYSDVHDSPTEEKRQPPSKSPL